MSKGVLMRVEFLYSYVSTGAEERQKDLQLLEAAAEGGAGKAGKMLVPKAQDADDEEDSDESDDDDDGDSVRTSCN